MKIRLISFSIISAIIAFSTIAAQTVSPTAAEANIELSPTAVQTTTPIQPVAEFNLYLQQSFTSKQYSLAFSSNEAQTVLNIENLFFQVTLASGELTPLQKIEFNDDLETDQTTTRQISQLYLYDEGYTAVAIYATSTDLPAGKIKLENSQQLTRPITAYQTYNASDAAEKLWRKTFMQKLGLNIVTRDEWGAPMIAGWTPAYAKVSKIVIHHTATGVDMTNPANTVRGIYNYHISPPLDWGDIGYNYLIDPYGTIYEGRSGGNRVVGAHSPPNSGKIGIAILGDFSNSYPTQAALDTLAKLIAYLSQVNDFSLDWQVGIFGHRDFQNTSCPGWAFYNLLPNVVETARSIRAGNSSLVNHLLNVKAVTNRLGQTGNLIAFKMNTGNVANSDIKARLTANLRNSVTVIPGTSLNRIYVSPSHLEQYISEILLVEPAISFSTEPDLYFPH